MNKPEFLTLLDLYLEGKATPREAELIVRYYESFGEREVDEVLLDEKEAAGLKRLMEEIRPAKVRKIHWVRYAAAAVLLFAVGGYWLVHRGDKTGQAVAVVKTDVQPGHAGAILHLKDGRTIATDTLNDGLIAVENGVRIVKENGVVRYEGASNEIAYNDFTTDKARMGTIELPDGTKVWLNAASSIHYPLRFTGNERVVEMTGECYFEVKHDASRPFRVKVAGQMIEDIGTAFNVNAYGDEPGMKATLAEGVIKVGEKILQPGQQYYKGVVSLVDVGQVVAWKNGLFSFGNEVDLATALRQISRWYDVEVVYEGGQIPQRNFGGKIQRDLTLSGVIEILREQKVNARIENKKLIVGD